jgi:hypothetical protein
VKRARSILSIIVGCMSISLCILSVNARCWVFASIGFIVWAYCGFVYVTNDL